MGAIQKSVLVICLLSVVAAEPIFKTNANDFIKIAHNTRTWRKETINDFTKLEVTASLMNMIEDVSTVDKERVTLEYKSEVGEWMVLETPDNMKAGIYTWTINDIVPCHNHNVRLTMYGQDGSASVFMYPDTIPAPSMEMIKASGYRPEPPRDIVVGDYYRGAVEVTWTPAYCAASYEVTYNPVLHRDQSQQFPVIGEKITLTDVQSCEEYEVKVSSVLGDEFSDQETRVVFLTDPETNVAQRLEPIVEAGVDSVLMKWEGSARLSCIPEYRVELCQEGGQCHDTVTMAMDDSQQWMEYTNAAQLTMCTPYTLTITPVNNKISVLAKKMSFKTKSQPLENIEQSLVPLTAAVDADTNVVLTWSAVPCAEQYTVYRRLVDSDQWSQVITTRDTASVTLQGEACTQFIYGVTVTVDGVESDKVETVEAVVINARDTELPVMVVEEKGNGTMTFQLKTNKVNTLCQVDKFHIRHAGEEEYFEFDQLDENGRLVINIKEETDIVEGRILYTEGTWSPWGSSDSPVMEKQTLKEMNFLLPIIIGSVIALVIILLVIFLVVKSKKDKTKYDEEKANGNTDESKKLNDSSEEKAINGKK